MRQGVTAVEGCRARTQCEERCEDGEHMCSPLHYRLPDTTQQHQTHHGYSYPPSSHLSSHWVRPLQPSTAVTHCATASYPLQHFYNTLQHSTVYSSTAFLQSTTSTTPLCSLDTSDGVLWDSLGSWVRVCRDREKISIPPVS